MNSYIYIYIYIFIYKYQKQDMYTVENWEGAEEF